MNRQASWLLSAVFMTAWSWTVASGEVYKPNGTPLKAKWEYSRDGGKTFSSEPIQVAVTRGLDAKNAIVARATFVIDDPAQIGALKLTTSGNTGGFALTDPDSVQRRYIGSYPNLLNTVLVVNGKETTSGHFPARLYGFLTIDAGLLKKGENVLTASGVFWQLEHEPVPGVLCLETLPADMVVLDREPVLGAIGEDFFSLTARAVIPCDYTVTVKPLDPPGPEKEHKFDKTRLLHAKTPVPKGTRKFSYSLTLKSGNATKVYGPYEVGVPAWGEGFRFIVAANTYIYGHAPDELKQFFAKLLDAKPQIFVHGGVFQNCATHDGPWTEQFFGYGKQALARIPMYAVPGYPDMYSPVAFGNEFYFPTADGTWDYWTQVIGQVRFIGIEALTMAEDNGRGLKWLEDVLKNAKEEYILVMNSQTPGCSGQNAKYFSKPATAYIEKNVTPLLAKYKVTATIGSYHYVYERVEPPAGEGVTTIMTSKAGGLGWPLREDMRAANKYSKVAFGYKNHYCEFEVKKDKLAMQVVDFDGKVLDTRDFAPRK